MTIAVITPKLPKLIMRTDLSLQFSFESTNQMAQVRLQRDPKDHARTEYVDPTPAYTLPLEAVERGIHIAETFFPPLEDVHIFVSQWEGMGRTNGWTTTTGYRGDKEGQKPIIYLSGKRIPPHPGMARYLVVHEYGHVIQNWLEYKTRVDFHKIAREYVAWRGDDVNPTHYGPGQWHLQPVEIMANDFRILVCHAEVDYWPHPGVRHPYEAEPYMLKRWWDVALNELNTARATWPQYDESNKSA